MGKWVYGRKTAEPIVVDVPAIVDPQLWEKAQKVRNLNAIDYLKTRKYHYLFAKRIRCGLCSTVVTGVPSNHRYQYYRCMATKKDEVANKECHAPHFRQDVVEGVVWDWIAKLLNDPQTLQEGLNAHLAEAENQTHPFRQRLEVVDSLISQNDAELERLLDLYISGDFPKEALVSRKNELETTIKSLEQEKVKLIEAIDERVITPEQIEDIHEFAAKVREGLAYADGDFAAKRAIVDALDLRVILTIENGEKIIYAECALGQEEFNVEPKNSATGGKGPGGKFSGNQTQFVTIAKKDICAQPPQIYWDLPW